MKPVLRILVLVPFLICVGPLVCTSQAQSLAEGPVIYPVLAYGKVWGIPDDVYSYPREEVSVVVGNQVTRGAKPPGLSATGMLFEKLEIPLPASEVPYTLEDESRFGAHYRPEAFYGKGTFRELRNPERVLKARFGAYPVRMQVVTTRGSFTTTVTKVLVEMELECDETTVLFAFPAAGHSGEPLFALPVSDAKYETKLLERAPLRAVRRGSPHLYIYARDGVRRTIILEEQRGTSPEPRNQLAAKDENGRVLFQQDFPPPKPYGSPLYLSPPILVGDERFPFFVVYSLGKRFFDGQSSWGDWLYIRKIFQLSPSGTLKQISGADVNIGGAACE